MSATTNLHHTTTTATVDHYPEMHFVSIDATDGDGSHVSLFFSAALDDPHELDQAQAWLRDALGKLQAVKRVHEATLEAQAVPA